MNLEKINEKLADPQIDMTTKAVLRNLGALLIVREVNDTSDLEVMEMSWVVRNTLTGAKPFEYTHFDALIREVRKVVDPTGALVAPKALNQEMVETFGAENVKPLVD